MRKFLTARNVCALGLIGTIVAMGVFGLGGGKNRGLWNSMKLYYGPKE
jgi:hypothetical protein